MDICNLQHDIVNKFRNIEQILSECKNVSNRERWIKLLRGHLGLFYRALKNSDSIGVRRKILTNIGHLKRIRVLITNSIHVVGRGLNVGENKRSSKLRWMDTKSAFGSRIRSGLIINLKHKDIHQFFNDAFFLFKSRISNILKKYLMIKVNACFCGEFIKVGLNSENVDFKYFNTKNVNIDGGTDLKEWFLENVIDKILNKLDEFQERDSGFALQKIIHLEINVNKISIGNGISSFIKLPGEIAKKHACINVKNYNDQACFFWSIVSCLYPAEHSKVRISSYPHYLTVLNCEDIILPMTLTQISKFEKQNNISVNVYQLQLFGKHFVTQPARLTKNKLARHVNLLMVQSKYFDERGQNDDNSIFSEEEILYHFCWIKNLSRLVSSQLNRHKGKCYICDICLNYFISEDKLNLHSVDCSIINQCKISFPKETKLSFKNYRYKEPVPFILYCDFESMLEPFSENSQTKTVRYQKHTAFSVGYYFKCQYDENLSSYRSNRSSNCVEWFINQLENISEFIEKKLKNTVVMVISEIQQREFEISTICHICEKPFEVDDEKIRDHCHLTGKYRGPAHKSCNLNYKNSFTVPVVFHNLTGYDSHLLIKDLAKFSSIRLLPINKEKYISFTKSVPDSRIKFRFIDSFRFMAASLDTLSSYLRKDELINLQKEFKDISNENLNLLTRKGVFPYDYINSLDKLSETKLPDKEQFYNKLNGSDITAEDYEHAKTVWNAFKIQNLGEYSDLYLKTDVILLADVFENFRQKCLNIYHLDAAYYYTLPGFTWDCMLKYTKIELEFLQDVDMLLFIERGIRGGVSQCCNRYAKANNKFMSSYNTKEPSKYLMYFDVNNLYGWAMSQALPVGEFQWMKNFENFNVHAVPDDADEGYILEVDVEYPETLHNLHKDIPLFPEHHIPPKSKLSKLLTTLYNKTRYVVHYRNLKQALELGIRLTKIHRILKFKQFPWLKAYIELNTKLRAESKNEFEKNLFKLLINAVYGKCMENVRKHRIVKLVNKWEGRYGVKNLIASPNFHSRVIFDENLIAIELNKSNIIFNKPIYVGMAILDISKTCVYDFHYNFMLKNFSLDRCKLLYTDTDSLIYELKSDNVYEELIKKHIFKFDTSDYQPNNQYDIPLENKKIPGLMKDECSGIPITHFIGLRSKMYSIQIEGKRSIKKSKGVKSNVVKNTISFEDYENCLKNNIELYRTQHCIKSILHDIYSIKQTKIALSPFDDKRCLLKDSTDTLPWGHFSILE